MAAASTASLSCALPHRKRGSFHDRYFKVLLLALAGYAFTGKGFAYAGVPPIFPGEMLLLFGLVSLFFPAPSWAIFSKAPNVLLVALMIWTVLRTVPYIGEFGADALRDSIIVMYGIFGFIVANLVLESPSRINDAIRLSGKFFTAYGFVAVILYTGQKYFAGIIPHWPVSDVPLIELRGGEVAVSLCGAALFGLLGLKRSTTAWALMLVLAFIVVAAQSRGGMLAVVLPVGLAAVLSGRFKPLIILACAVIPVFTVLYVTDVDIPMQSDRRTIKASQLIENVASTFGQTEANDTTLDDTKQWRLQWWDRITHYTLLGDYFWSGKGFGINIAASDGIPQANATNGPPLRSPHSAHMTILARSGVPGLALWISVGIAWILMLSRSIFRAKIRRDVEWSHLLTFIMCFWIGIVIDASFDVALEGPMLGILFWVVFGFGTALSMAYDGLCRAGSKLCAET